MPGPARAGLFVYAKDAERVAGFFEAVAALVRLHRTEDLIVLQSPDIQLLVHRIPPAIATGIEIETPPRRREDTALKFFFAVASLADARASARLAWVARCSRRTGAVRASWSATRSTRRAMSSRCVKPTPES